MCWRYFSNEQFHLTFFMLKKTNLIINHHCIILLIDEPQTTKYKSHSPLQKCLHSFLVSKSVRLVYKYFTENIPVFLPGSEMLTKSLILFFLGVTSSIGVDAVPAYSHSNYNTWDTITTTTPQPTRRGGKLTLDKLVRQHMNELDRQTRSDMKVLSFLEDELQKVFGCYFKLSCARLRTPQVLAECDEIKDWPLYHQVMKMAGIKKYPYQSRAPVPTTRLPSTTTRVSSSRGSSPSRNFINEPTSNDNLPTDTLPFDEDDEDSEELQMQRDARHRPNRRIRSLRPDDD